MAKKRGRPKKPKSERLDTAILIRFSGADLKAIKSEAAALGLSPSLWARIQLQKAAGLNKV